MKFLVILSILGLYSFGYCDDFDSDGIHSRSIIDLDEDVAANPETESNYWLGKSFLELEKQLKKKPQNKRAKNVIMFLGDGMSIPTLAAARFYGAELENARVSEGEYLSFEQFPYIGLSKTYCVDSQVADSACSATAYLGGVKSNKGTIGVNGRVRRGDCVASLEVGNRVDSIAVLAQKAGKATGIVTNTRVTHASPAGAYAHSADRDWESDYEIQRDGQNSTACDDIAKQLILNEPGKNFNVIMGGGRRSFLSKIEKDTIENKPGFRLDNMNLINEWKRDKMARKKRYTYVKTRQELRGLVDTPDYLLGLFAYSHMDDHIYQNPLQPTLEEMTEEAIKILQKNKNGFFLFIEGGRIDMAHHSSQAHISLDETLEFSKAIAKAAQMTSEKDTLIVVTSDHAHTMSFSGYAKRSESIFGIAGVGGDKLPYSVLSYANGPGYNLGPKGRKDISLDDTKKFDYVFSSGVPLKSETHGGDDVGVFARGPFSHIFCGSYEQNYIPLAMAFAANLSQAENFNEVY